MARGKTNAEVRSSPAPSVCSATERVCVLLEQRKAALRRVEMELDEADEMVGSFPYSSPLKAHNSF